MSDTSNETEKFDEASDEVQKQDNDKPNLLSDPIFTIGLIVSPLLIIVLAATLYSMLTESTAVGSAAVSNTQYPYVSLGSILMFALPIYLLASLITLWKLPLFQTKILANNKDKNNLSEFEKIRDYLKLKDDTRKTTVQVIGGISLILSGYLAFITYEQNREAKNTELFSKAFELMEKESTTPTGLFLLKRAIRDSGDDVSDLIESLCSNLQKASPAQGSRTLHKNTLREIIQTVIQLGQKHPDREVDLSRLNLTGLGLVFDGTFPKYVDLTGSNLEGIKLDEVDLRYAALKDAQFYKVDFSKVKLGSKIVSLNGADLTHVRLFGSKVRIKDGDPRYDSAARVDTSCTERPGFFQKYNCDLKDLAGADFRSADLTGNATLRSADLTGANLGSAILTQADLTYADLTNADLEKAVLTETILFNADLSASKNLTLDQLKGALIDKDTKLPSDLEKNREFLLANTKEILLEQSRRRERLKITGGSEN